MDIAKTYQTTHRLTPEQRCRVLAAVYRELFLSCPARGGGGLDAGGVRRSSRRTWTRRADCEGDRFRAARDGGRGVLGGAGRWVSPRG
jgi:hypothetical protein